MKTTNNGKKKNDEVSEEPTKDTKKNKSKSGSKTSKTKTMQSKDKKKDKKKDNKKSNKKDKTKNSESDEPTSRYFKLIDPETKKAYGRYTGDTPKQAASKGYTKMIQKCKADKKTIPKKCTIYLRESTRGSPRKIYGYEAKRIRLDKPQELIIVDKETNEEKTIVYNYRNKIRKVQVPENFLGDKLKSSKNKKKTDKSGSKKENKDSKKKKDTKSTKKKDSNKSKSTKRNSGSKSSKKKKSTSKESNA